MSRPKLTNLTKVFWPEDGLTKGDLLAYYETVAPTLLPHLRGRPMTLLRLPNGIHGQAFYQKNAAGAAPDWVHEEKIWSEDSQRWIRYIVVDDLGTLLYCIQLGCISLSPYSSRVGTLEHPDFAIMDLDPGDDCPFEKVVELALLVREILEEIGLRGYAKTSGATGIHVQVPLEPCYGYEDSRVLAQIIGTIAEARRPDLVTLVRNVQQRGKGKIYFDYLQNGQGKTVAGPYSVREKPKAPVSTPLRWDELTPELRPERFLMKTFPERLARVGDLWRPMLEDKQRLEDSLVRLRGLLGRSGGG